MGVKSLQMFGGTIDAQVLMRTDLVKFSADLMQDIFMILETLKSDMGD